jgi:MFS family permease
MSHANTDRHENRVFWSAALTSAPVEFLDFLLPLWAASQLGAPPLQVGLIVSMEAALSLCVRPVAGVLSDRFDRSRVAAYGAGLYAISFLGYAAATGIWMALAAAALQGVAGALFGVAIGSKVSEGEEGSRAYGKLLSWESSGTLVGFVVGFLMLQPIGYQGVFALGAGACVFAAVFLLLGRVPADTRTVGEPSLGMRDLWKRFWPLLVVICVTATAEAGVGLLLLLHLQQGFGFSVYEVAYVFLPGALMFVILPEYTHVITDRLGRYRTMIVSLLASAGLAFSLSFVPGPVTIAVLWALWAVCLAAAIPVEQGTVAAAAGGSVGRGMGLYESAVLVGLAIGPVLFGALYGTGGWQTACLAMSAVLIAGAVTVPLALRGLPDRRPSPEIQRRADTPPAPDPAEAPTSREGAGSPGRGLDLEHARKERQGWYWHLAAFAVGQAILFAAGDSWIAAQLTGEVPEEVSALMRVSQVWCVVFVIDTVWSLSHTVFPRRKKV